jgi:hypothetical protein
MQVGDDVEERIGGDRHLAVFGLQNDSVTRNRTSMVGGAYTIEVGGEMSTVIGRHEKPRSGELFAFGDYSIGAGKMVRIRAEGGVRLLCGDSSLELTQQGVRLKGSKLLLEGTTSTTLKGNGPALELADEAELAAKTVRVVSEKASLELDQEAKLDGTKVKLNCKGIGPASSNEDGSPPPTKKVSLKLTDGEFAAVAGKAWILVAGGAKFEGTTDGDGALEVEVPEEAETASLTVFAGERPEGLQLKYRVQLVALPPPESVPGVKARLRNLGYYWGDVDEVVDPRTEDAVREFQRDHELEETGLVDGATRAKLTELAGQ